MLLRMHSTGTEMLSVFSLCCVLATASSFLVPAPALLYESSAGQYPGVSSARRAGRPSSIYMASERTYIMVKPDGVQRGLVSEIMSRFERKGYKLVALKMLKPPAALLEEHYSALREKPFFPKLMTYMGSGPVVAMVWEGKEIVATGRKMLGATNPLASEPGTIRGDFAIEVGRNICHGSDSVDSAKREIGLWFSNSEVQNWENHSSAWLYE